MDRLPDFEWISAHAADDPARLRLRYGRERETDILQIDCRRRFAAKIAGVIAADPRFVFPTALSGEQSTSERLAAFHASLIPSGARVADLTAGLGIDVMAFASVASSVTAVERDATVAAALRHNTRNMPGVTVVNADCRDFVAGAEPGFDVIFIDPARRDISGGRTYALADCSPDVTAMMPSLTHLAPRVIIKASPMLDIAHTVASLPSVACVIALGTPTECKELDVMVEAGAAGGDPEIRAVTVFRDGGESVFRFTRGEEAAASVSYGVPAVGDCVFDPYPAVMKAGGMKLLAARFGLSKLAPNTHLWHGAAVPDGFPGHAFRVTEVQPFASRVIRRYASAHPRVGVTARNFDMSADALRGRLGVKDGPGRLFAVSDAAGARWLLTAEPL